jgi:hypothetical protein
MSEVSGISQEDKELMLQYNIRTETRTVFYYEGYKYEKLHDAIRYAKLSRERAQPSSKD